MQAGRTSSGHAAAFWRYAHNRDELRNASFKPRKLEGGPKEVARSHFGDMLTPLPQALWSPLVLDCWWFWQAFQVAYAPVAVMPCMGFQVATYWAGEEAKKRRGKVPSRRRPTCLELGASKASAKALRETKSFKK